MKKIISAVLCTAGLGPSAEITNNIPAANRVVVTATRNTTPVRSVAGNPSVITSGDIESGRYTSVPEALQKKAGVFFRNISDNPSRAAVDIRGFGGDAPFGRTLVLLNGRKLNRPDMATINWAQIPIQTVKKIEVIRGPNSVLYGDHAVGGVINILTKEASETPETTLQASYGTDEAVNQSFSTSGSLNGLGYAATLGHQSGDGYRERSRYDTSSASLRLSGNMTDSLSAYAEVSGVKEQHQLPGALTWEQMNLDRKQSMNPDDAARGEYFNVQAGTEALLSDEILFTLDGSIATKELEADFPSYWIATYYDYKLAGATLSPKLTLLVPVFGLDNELIIGADLSREKLKIQKYFAEKRETAITDTKAEKRVVGGYVANTLSLTDSLLLNGGFRWEENKVETTHRGGFSPYKDAVTHRETAWQGSVTWLPCSKLKLFAGIDQTYRYPFLDEQALFTGWGDAFNKDLEPETGINVEAGFEYMPFSNLTFQVTAFQTDMEDEIAWAGSSNINLDETLHRGVELSATYHNEYIAVDLFYTWLQAEFSEGRNDGNEIPWVPQNQFNANLSVFLTDALTAGAHFSYLGSMYPLGDNDNNSLDRQSNVALVDLLLQYELPLKKCKAVLFAGVDNVFETEHNYLVTDYGFGAGYYPAPERTAKAGLSITF